ncbi:MAG: hypothetical protein ACRD24_10755, partial [Terriglobales bacterium]
CGCPAGSPAPYSRAPLPCYHVAAAMLSGEAIAPAPAPVPTPEAKPHARTHAHHCIHCHDHFRCGASFCAGVDDSICDSCDEREADQISWEGIYGN